MDAVSCPPKGVSCIRNETKGGNVKRDVQKIRVQGVWRGVKVGKRRKRGLVQFVSSRSPGPSSIIRLKPTLKSRPHSAKPIALPAISFYCSSYHMHSNNYVRSLWYCFEPSFFSNCCWLHTTFEFPYFLECGVLSIEVVYYFFFFF